MPVLTLDNRYSNKLNNVLNFAHTHGDKELHLDQLAECACLSKFHFTRVFRDCIQESPVGFLRRIRLERAASLLKQERHLSVTEISWRCGFSTPQLFSRAFAEHFGLAPRRFRGNHLARLEDSSRRGYLESIRASFESILEHTGQSIMTDHIRLSRIPPTRVAYVGNIGKYGGCGGISVAMDAIRHWAMEHGIWTPGSDVIGISWDYSSITPEGLCRYDACVAISGNTRRVSTVSQQMIPGGLYATARFAYRHPRDLTRIWWWFSQTIKSSPKFEGFKASLNIGPWYEVYKPVRRNGFPQIQLFTRLHQNSD